VQEEGRADRLPVPLRRPLLRAAQVQRQAPCDYDYKEAGADEIRKSNPVVAGEKVRRI